MANEEGWEVGTWYGHPIYKVSCISQGHFSLKPILIVVLPLIPPGPEVQVQRAISFFCLPAFDWNDFPELTLYFQTTGDKWIDVTFDEFYAHCDK